MPSRRSWLIAAATVLLSVAWAVSWGCDVRRRQAWATCKKDNSPGPGPSDVLTLSETLELAAKLHFNPVLGCWRSLLWPQRSSFLGPLHTIRTGPVLQAYHRFQRTDCSSSSMNSSSSSSDGRARNAGSSGDSSSHGGGGGNGGPERGTRASQRLIPGSSGAASPAGKPDPAPPPLVLISGLGATMASWGVRLLKELSCHREIILLENRGAGLSKDYSTDPLTYYSMADSVLMLVDALNLTTPPDILGWSTGGNIGLILAALHGDRVGKVVALAAMAGSNNTVLPDVPDIFEPPIFNTLSLAQKMAMLFPPQDPDFAAATCAYIGSVFWMPRGTLEVSEEVMAAQAEADANFTTVDPTVWDALPSVRNPVLLVAGDQDAAVPPINSERIAARTPGAQLVQVPGWGHAFKNVSQFVDMVVEFLDGDESASAGAAAS